MWKVTYFTYNNYLYIDLFKLLFTIINTTLLAILLTDQ